MFGGPSSGEYGCNGQQAEGRAPLASATSRWRASGSRLAGGRGGAYSPLPSRVTDRLQPRRARRASAPTHANLPDGRRRIPQPVRDHHGEAPRTSDSPAFSPTARRGFAFSRDNGSDGRRLGDERRRQRRRQPDAREPDGGPQPGVVPGRPANRVCARRHGDHVWGDEARRRLGQAQPTPAFGTFNGGAGLLAGRQAHHLRPEGGPRRRHRRHELRRRLGQDPPDGPNGSSDDDPALLSDGKRIASASRPGPGRTST